MRDHSRDTKKLAPALLKRPEIFPDLLETWEAFWQLNPSRPEYFGSVGFIPMTEILAMADALEIKDRVFFLNCIREMDRVFIEWQTEHAQTNAS